MRYENMAAPTRKRTTESQALMKQELTTPLHKATQILIPQIRSAASSGDATIYTVPAGKVFFLSYMSIALNEDDDDASQYCRIYANINSGDVWLLGIQSGTDINTYGWEHTGNHIAVALAHPIQIAAGDYIKTYKDNATVSYVCIHGWLEDD